MRLTIQCSGGFLRKIFTFSEIFQEQLWGKSDCLVVMKTEQFLRAWPECVAPLPAVPSALRRVKGAGYAPAPRPGRAGAPFFPAAPDPVAIE